MDDFDKNVGLNDIAKNDTDNEAQHFVITKPYH